MDIKNKTQSENENEHKELEDAGIEEEKKLQQLNYPIIPKYKIVESYDV